MALLKCPECDSQVSDKAQCCPKCGFPVKDMIEMERKATQESIRTKCKKVMGIALTIVVLCVVAIGVIAVIKRPDTSGLYNKIAWGSSEAQIKKEYPKGTDGKDDDKDNDCQYLGQQHGRTPPFPGSDALMSLCSGGTFLPPYVSLYLRPGRTMSLSSPL